MFVTIFIIILLIILRQEHKLVSDTRVLEKVLEKLIPTTKMFKDGENVAMDRKNEE